MAGGERRRSQPSTGIFFKCSFFGKALGSLTPKGVEERLDETLFLGKVRHGAPIPLHQQSGSIPSWVLQVSLCLQDSRFPWSVFHCPAPPWLFHSPRQARTHPCPPGFPVWGVLGDWGRRGAQHPSGTECQARRDGACWDSRWDAASPGMAPQGTTADSGELPLPPAAPKSWSWTPGSALGVVFRCFPPVVSTFYHNNQTAAF